MKLLFVIFIYHEESAYFSSMKAPQEADEEG